MKPLDPRTLRAVVRRLRDQAAKASNEREDAFSQDKGLEGEFWSGSEAACHRVAGALLEEARAIEKRRTRKAGKRG